MRILYIIQDITTRVFLIQLNNCKIQNDEKLQRSRGIVKIKTRKGYENKGKKGIQSPF